MARYHFHDANGVEHHDSEGMVLPDLDAARDQAAILLGRIVADDPRTFWADGEHVVRCTDHTGLTLFEVRASGQDAPVLSAGH